MGHGRQKQARAALQVGGDAHEIVKLLRGVTGSRSLHEVWRDWITCMALALANVVDHRTGVRDQREAEFHTIVGRYPAGTMDVFAKCQALLVWELEIDPRDVLGSLYMGLELGNDSAGQFFTPYHLCQAMARLLIGDVDELRATVAKRGYITVSEPAIGGGAMIIAFAMELREAGLDHTTQMHVIGVDIDRSVLLSAYVQLCLLGIPGVLIVGDTLRMIEREHWYTSVHVFGGWEARLALGRMVDKMSGLLDLCGPVPKDASEDESEPDVPGLDVAMDEPVEAIEVVRLDVAVETPGEPEAPVQGSLFDAW